MHHTSIDVDLCNTCRVTSVLEITPTTDAACCTPGTGGMASSAATDLARTLKALADPARLRLLSIVSASEGQEACVCDLTDPIGLSQATVSYHLKMLTDAGFLTRSKRGTWAYYRLVPEALNAAGAAVSAL